MMTEVDRLRFACLEGRFIGAEGVTRIAQATGRDETITLVRFDRYDAVGDAYGVVYQMGGAYADPYTWNRFASRSEAADHFAEAAEFCGL